MKKELLFAAFIYVVCVALASFVWHRPAVLLISFLVASGLALYRWHTKADVVFYLVALVFGTVADFVAVAFGAWEYTNSSLVPVWLPFLWGIAGLLLKRITETLTSVD
jgi:hypothetical protein